MRDGNGDSEGASSPWALFQVPAGQRALLRAWGSRHQHKRSLHRPAGRPGGCCVLLGTLSTEQAPGLQLGSFWKAAAAGPSSQGGKASGRI